MSLLMMTIFQAKANGFDYVYNKDEPLDFYQWQLPLLVILLVVFSFFIYRLNKGK